MNISSDRFIDFNQVPDMGGMIPSGIVQWRIIDFEEKMTSAEGVVEKGDRAGQPKIAKLMYVMHIEGIAPEEAVGLKWKEYFVLGNDSDPLAQNTQTLYDSIGMRQLKAVLGAAQIPFNNSLVATLNSSIGAMYCQRVIHKRDKRNDTGEPIVSAVMSRTYKIGEVQPQFTPCLLDPVPQENFQGCMMCISARAAGKGAPNIPQGMPLTMPATAPPVTMPQPPKPAMPPMAPVAPPVMPTAPQTQAPGVIPPQPVSMPQIPPQMPTAPQAPIPSTAPGMPPAPVPGPTAPPIVQQPVAPAPVDPVPSGVPTPSVMPPAPSNPVPPATAPPQAPVQTMPCPVCQVQVAFTDFSAHMLTHQQPPQPQFQQEA